MKPFAVAVGLALLGFALIVAGIAAYDPRLSAVVAGLLLVAAGLFAVKVDQ